MLETLDNTSDAADLNPVNPFNGKVQAVVALFAPSDLPTMFHTTARQSTLAALMRFTYQDPARGGGVQPDNYENQKYRETSPVTHIHAACAMLLYHRSRRIIPTSSRS